MGIFDKLFGSTKTTRLDVSSRFRLERQSTTGTMSTFRVAVEIGTGKRYGIKFLDAEKTEYFKNRFRGLDKPSEGEIAVQIKHPNIVETVEFGLTTTGQEYILMEFIEGPGAAIGAHQPHMKPPEPARLGHAAGMRYHADFLAPLSDDSTTMHATILGFDKFDLDTSLVSPGSRRHGRTTGSPPLNRSADHTIRVFCNRCSLLLVAFCDPLPSP